MALAPVATGELVGITWLKANGAPFGIEVDKIASTLPRDATAWAGTGFLTVRALPGGSYAPNGTKRSTTLQVDAWWSPSTASASSGKVPWAKANNLIEAVVMATEAPVTPYSSTLALPGAFPAVQVLSVYPAYGEPTRIEDDPNGYARYQLDLSVDWARV